MPLIYLQLVNDAKADTIFQFTEMFGTQISFERYDNSRNKRPNQCWRCQGFFHSSEVCHLPIKCLKCAGPHEAKNCNRAFEDPLICANCGGEHAANWRQCPHFPKTKNNKKAPQKGNQNKTQHPKGNNSNNLPQNKIQERRLGSRNDLNLKSSMHAQSKIQQPQSNYRAVIPSVSYSKVVSGQIREISHVNTSNSNFSTIFTNVIQIANDEGVDEELLARAFRAALPALRKLSHPDDKACEIFQAYVALKNGRNYVAHNSAYLSIVQTYNQSQLGFGTQTVCASKFMNNEHLDVAIGRLGENISETLVAASKPKFKTAPIKLPPDIRSKIRHRNRVRRFWQRSRDPALKNELRTISNEIASDIRHLSRARWEKTIELSPETGTLWRRTFFLKKLFHHIAPLKGVLGSIAVAPIEKAEVSNC
ncbi:RNA-directed DNA polymerase from mobile element jockey [Trichonephila clavipes]|nr:RNA-directed DNA polymerase from mobile element jockey [Trichonephila clavipes]